MRNSKSTKSRDDESSNEIDGKFEQLEDDPEPIIVPIWLMSNTALTRPKKIKGMFTHTKSLSITYHHHPDHALFKSDEAVKLRNKLVMFEKGRSNFSGWP